MRVQLSNWVLATLVLTTAFGPVPTAWADGGMRDTAVLKGHFSDVSHVAQQSQTDIEKAASLGLIAGDPTGRFRPDDDLTRQEWAVLLTRALQLPVNRSVVSSFSDVPTDQWAQPSIEAVKQAGIMQGDQSRFRPEDLVTREELAVILVRALNIQEANASGSLMLTDEDRISEWAKAFVHAAVSANLMMAESTAFNPRRSITRQEMAGILLKMDSAHKQAGTIERVDGEQVIINGVSYQVSDRVKGILSEENRAILQGANVTFERRGGRLEKLTSLEILNSGTDVVTGEPEFTRNLLLNGQGSIIDGDVQVAGDFVTLQDLQITGRLLLAEALQHDFSAVRLNVLGSTEVLGGDTHTVSFTDSTLTTMDVNKQDVHIESKGATSVEQVNVASNASLTADSTSTVKQVTVQEGAKQVELNGAIQTVTIDTKDSLALSGHADVQTVAVQSNAPLAFNMTGQIAQLQVTNVSASMTLGSGVKVASLQLPAGVAPANIVSNYATAQTQIASVNGLAPVQTGGTVNRKPVVAGGVPDQMILLSGGPVTLDVSNAFTDPDGDSMSFTTTSLNSTIVGAAISGTTLTLAPKKSGSTKVGVTAFDGHQSTSLAFNVTVDQEPVATGTMIDKTFNLEDGAQTLDLTGVFTDPDLEVLTYSAVSSDTNVATVAATGSQVTVTPAQEGTSTIKVTAKDTHGATAQTTFVLTIKQNHAPQPLGVLNRTVKLEDGEFTVDLTSAFQDADGDALTYAATSGTASVATIPSPLSGTQLKIQPQAEGTSTVTVTATDIRGATAQLTFVLTVKQNHAPQVIGLSNQTAALEAGDCTVDLSSGFLDSEGDAMTYTATSGTTTVATVASVTGSQLKLSPHAEGTSTITVTADDGHGHTAQTSFVLTVTQNHAPQVIGLSNQTADVDAGDFMVDLTSGFQDSDGDALTYTVTSGTTTVATVASVTGSQLKLSPLAQGTSTFTVTADDGHGHTAQTTFVLTVTQNHAPQVIGLSKRTIVLADGEATVDLSGAFQDADGDSMTYTASSDTTSVATVTSPVVGTQLKLTPQALGTSTITVTATDSHGATAQTTFTLTVAAVATANQAPTLKSQIGDQIIANGVPGESFDLSQYFQDADGDALTYAAVSSDSTKVSPQITNGQLTFQPTGLGITTITVTADDGNNGTVSMMISVHAVQIVPNGNLTITTKQGIPNVTVDTENYFPGKSATDLSVVQSQNATLNAFTLTMVPSGMQPQKAWVIASDHTAMLVHLVVVAQGAPTPFFSEYDESDESRIALEIYWPGDGTDANASGYELSVYRWDDTHHTMDIIKKPLFDIVPNTVAIAINSIFYDFFDITRATYYNYDDVFLGGDGKRNCAFVLKKNGQVIDIMGSTDAVLHQPILQNGGTLIRKSGITTGSGTYDMYGEWNLLPKNTWQFIGSHTP